MVLSNHNQTKNYLSESIEQFNSKAEKHLVFISSHDQELQWQQDITCVISAILYITIIISSFHDRGLNMSHQEFMSFRYYIFHQNKRQFYFFSFSPNISLGRASLGTAWMRCLFLSQSTEARQWGQVRLCYLPRELLREGSCGDSGISSKKFWSIFFFSKFKIQVMLCSLYTST